MTDPHLLIRGERRRIDTTLVMGVVNASPESFSDAGQFDSLESRLELAASLVEAGADIIDIGGQSAITNQPEIDANLEIERVVPIVRWMRREHPDVLVSVDTYKISVVDAVIEAGADIINDVSGLRNAGVAVACARSGSVLVIMHTAAAPKVRLQDPRRYRDVSSEVSTFLRERLEEAVSLGVDRDAIILDPGPDFTKTPAQTVAMLRNLDPVKELGRPLLLALSRKDFLGAITGRTPKGRGPATDAAIGYFARQPGSIVRVHDVAAARDVIATVETLEGLRDISADYLLPDVIRHEPVN